VANAPRTTILIQKRFGISIADSPEAIALPLAVLPARKNSSTDVDSEDLRDKHALLVEMTALDSSGVLQQDNSE